MVLSIEQIKNLIEPIAKKYRLRAVYVFGSYARGEATPNSDIDLLIDRKGSCINSMFDMGNLYNELCDKCKKEIDIVTTQTLKQQSTQKRMPIFIKNLEVERVKIYG
ncbi:MAG: nucleotidyltransferase domain-containing protein [Candidatus Caccosoma sp.]|nr:nucleotidyltransferase domain-containing protein [Candidatus Caccosoma sp.]